MIFNVAESVVVAVMVYMTTRIVNTQILHGEELASHRTEIRNIDSRVENIDMKGSRAVESLTVEVGTIKREMIEVRQAITILQTAPGELKAINVRLDGLVDGQKRIEKALDEHMIRQQNGNGGNK